MQHVWQRIQMLTGFWCGNLSEGDNLKEPVIDGRIILKLIFEKWDGSTDWIDLALDRDRWRALVKAVINLRVP